MHSQHPHLREVEIAALRPTQMSVGLAEVEAKRAEWRQLDHHARTHSLQQHWFPAVLGPGQAFYIVDHHHLGLALHGEGVSKAWVMLLKDMSWLSPAEFWRNMEFRQWAHPYDEHGHRRDYEAMPGTVSELRDDPWRSLAGFVRRAGGYAKDTTPFAEFLWADHFRTRIRGELIRHDPDAAVQAAVALAKLPEARHLPGWSGAHHG